MNRSTLLFFIYMFALSEVLLAAKMARIRGVAEILKFQTCEKMSNFNVNKCNVKGKVHIKAMSNPQKKLETKRQQAFPLGKNSSGVRLVRTAGCPTNSQCDKMCKTMDGASGGRLSNNDNSYCHCDDDVGKPDTKETCVARCKILGVGVKFADKWCFCNDC